MEELVDARTDFGWTVITTNMPVGVKADFGSEYNASPFAKRYGERVRDRLAFVGRLARCGAANLRREQVA